MCSSRRVSDLSLSPRRLFRRADVAKHYHNPRDARHCDHKDKYNREDQEKIAHRRISLLNPSSGELSLRPFEPQCRALLHNPIRLRYHCIQDKDAQVIATNPRISETTAKAPRLTRPAARRFSRHWPIRADSSCWSALPRHRVRSAALRLWRRSKSRLRLFRIM